MKKKTKKPQKKWAKVTFTETGEGTVLTDVLFNPPVSREKATGCHRMAYEILDALVRNTETTIDSVDVEV